MFKPGDRVKRIGSIPPWLRTKGLKVGDIVTVHKVVGHLSVYVEEYPGCSWSIRRFQLVPNELEYELVDSKIV